MAITIRFSSLGDAESAHADGIFICAVDSLPIHLLPRNSRSGKLIGNKNPSTSKKVSSTSNELPRYKSGFWRHGTTNRFVNGGAGSENPINK